MTRKTTGKEIIDNTGKREFDMNEVQSELNSPCNQAETNEDEDESQPGLR